MTRLPPMPSDVVDVHDMHETLVARARALRPALRARIAACEAGRRIPDETMRDLHEAGFFRMLQPRRWGGLEVHPNTFFDVQIEVAKGCSSTAWVLGVVAVHNWQLALFPLEAQQDVWGEDDQVLISSSYAPTGKAERVEGGYRLSGRWSFSSGVDHCGWAFLGAFAPVEAGQPPDMRTFLVPLREAVIEDTWHTFALKGTGSKDVVLDGVFVPEHRTHRMSDGFRCKNPGHESNPAPLFRLPFGQVFVRSVSTTAIGIAEAAVEFYREVTAVKVGASDGKAAADEPMAQLTLARAASTVEQLKLVLHRNFEQMMVMAEAGVAIPIEQRVAWRWDSADAVSRAVEVVDDLFTLCGGRALFLESPMHRFFLDVHGARAHYANRPEAVGRNYGRVLLGQRTQDFFL
jgi:3-hydroxy-9,10-secoandrosta-1,3,5(10)-triene-9,17-dione monooxygenase